ncbi:MAG: ABC transporter ATP-binding protein [Clostridiales bacterium]|nr:ABC transporter ATP-binding protein [Clostridiales bacterium]
MSAEPLLSVRGLHADLMSPYGAVRAVRGVDLELFPGEIVGLVGESGCGKTITAKSIIRLNNEETTFYRGEILLGGTDLLTLPEKEMTRVRGGRVAMIFQDPMTALDPLKRVGRQIEETFMLHGAAEAEARAGTLALLAEVGIHPAEERARSYPFEMSGGQLQRALIACALAGSPQLLIADEPTTALDVTVQAQILRLLRDLQRRTAMTVLLITHDFGIVAETCERVAVMYAGRIAEIGPVRSVFHNARHPYTRDLIRSIPTPDGRPEAIPGAPPDLRASLTGCAYAPRCRHAEGRCRTEQPPMREAGGGHRFACFFELAASAAPAAFTASGMPEKGKEAQR